MAPDRPFIGIVVGLAAEARLARRLGGVVAIGGGTANGALDAARRLANSGATALISFGLAGGLDPSLQPGDIVVPETVRTNGHVLQTDPRLCRMLGGPRLPHLLDIGRIISDPTEKQALWRQTGCAAIDLESGAVAETAVERNLPFGVLRVICDPSHHRLPPAACAALDARGAVALGRVLQSLARQPLQLRALLALTVDATRARRAMRRHLNDIAAQESLTFSR